MSDDMDTERITFRCSPAERLALEQAASAAGFVGPSGKPELGPYLRRTLFRSARIPLAGVNRPRTGRPPSSADDIV